MLGRLSVSFAVLGLLAGVSPLAAQYSRPLLTRGVTIEQKLGSPVPLDLVFHDETGQLVPLRSYFGEKPVILSPVYFKCPSLCPMSLRETATSLKRVPLQTGIDYEVVVVSFDPTDTPADAAKQKEQYGKMFGRAGYASSWHFLTGSKENIEKLTSAIGFGYRWDETSKQYIHAGGIMVATPEGKMARYFYGVDYAVWP
jgi:protein SCO1